jgi:hypothetical protein
MSPPTGGGETSLLYTQSSYPKTAMQDPFESFSVTLQKAFHKLYKTSKDTIRFVPLPYY